MNAVPRYRADIKGQLSKLKAECVDSFRGEIRNSDDFVVLVEDATQTVREYQDYLTPEELAACFKRATK